ncbi:hypothetical protein [Mycobacterium sp. AZCC_0083]|uniref:hypothetical protein n=1 Tax=Mycobacterium sp. AZCC_0083 TaxID=2735882 RepID=UPI00161105AD|nr:hypothetical protein [Mycobacterium sp. AZCC_0083]MBB5167294.1 hypothetical protein [Mycobacterium sp. AZCC_0083]
MYQCKSKVRVAGVPGATRLAMVANVSGMGGAAVSSGAARSTRMHAGGLGQTVGDNGCDRLAAAGAQRRAHRMFTQP